MKQNGFTLIELIAAVTISLLVGVGAMVAVTSFDNKEKSKAASDAFLEELRMARNFAVTSQLPASFPVNQNLQYTQMVYSGGSMAVQAVDGANNAYTYPNTVRNLGITATVTFSGGFTNTIYFSVFRGSLMKYVGALGRVVLADPTDTANIRIDYQSNIKNVYVSTAGQIYSQ